MAVGCRHFVQCVANHSPHPEISVLVLAQSIKIAAKGMPLPALFGQALCGAGHKCSKMTSPCGLCPVLLFDLAKRFFTRPEVPCPCAFSSLVLGRMNKIDIGDMQSRGYRREKGLSCGGVGQKAEISVMDAVGGEQ